MDSWRVRASLVRNLAHDLVRAVIRRREDPELMDRAEATCKRPYRVRASLLAAGALALCFVDCSSSTNAPVDSTPIGGVGGTGANGGSLGSGGTAVPSAGAGGANHGGSAPIDAGRSLCASGGATDAGGATGSGGMGAGGTGGATGSGGAAGMNA